MKSVKTPERPEKADRAIRAMLAEMQPGEQLPTARELEADLGVNYRTVMRVLVSMTEAGTVARKVRYGFSETESGGFFKP